MKTNKNGAVGTIITIVFLIVVVVISNIGTDRLAVVGNTINGLFMPVQNAFVYIKDKITGKDAELSDIDRLKEENQNLKNEKNKLQEQVKELEILKSENNTLKDYLNLRNKYAEFSTVPGYVIEKSFSNYDKIIVINVGSNDGIAENMPVISDAGLVGHVISVTPNTAKVQTIIDNASTVSAMISTTNNSILLKGTMNNTSSVKVTSIPSDATVLQGDEVITSGLGGIYPKGILIGSINEIVNTKNEMDRYAMVQTAIDFNKLETLLVITK